MTPETIEVIKSGFTVAAAVGFSVAFAYLVFQFLTLCENAAAIKDNTLKARNDAEYTRYDIKSIERHTCRARCGSVCIHE